MTTPTSHPDTNHHHSHNHNNHNNHQFNSPTPLPSTSSGVPGDSTLPLHPQQAAPRVKPAKAHVPSACINCKKAHLACDCKCLTTQSFIIPNPALNLYSISTQSRGAKQNRVFLSKSWNRAANSNSEQSGRLFFSVLSNIFSESVLRLNKYVHKRRQPIHPSPTHPPFFSDLHSVCALTSGVHSFTLSFAQEKELRLALTWVGGRRREGKDKTGRNAPRKWPVSCECLCIECVTSACIPRFCFALHHSLSPSPHHLTSPHLVQPHPSTPFHHLISISLILLFSLVLFRLLPHTYLKETRERGNNFRVDTNWLFLSGCWTRWDQNVWDGTFLFGQTQNTHTRLGS